jgi:hypothetical protein
MQVYLWLLHKSETQKSENKLYITRSKTNLDNWCTYVMYGRTYVRQRRARDVRRARERADRAQEAAANELGG